MRRPKTIHVISLGCSKNFVDTEVMCGHLAVHGFALTGSLDDADIVLINTCGFLESARDEAGGEIADALRWRKAKAGRKLVVSGCFPQKAPEKFRERYPEVDLVLGIDDIPKVAELFAAMLKAGSPAQGEGLANRSPAYLYDHLAPRLQLTPAHYAYVKIADGCNHGCRYCSIPLIRGRQRSRTMDSVEAECRGFIEAGVKELNLVAQDTSRYGDDLKDGSTLAALLERLDAIPGDHWIRVLYFHPRHVGDALLAALPRFKHLVPYVDIPLQHISDRMLAAMGRRMTGSETRAIMAKLRQAWPQATIRTTFIVGHPGETEADFTELRDFISEFRFDRLGVFAYSPEEGTPSAKLTEGLVPAELAAQRRDTLMELQQPIALAKNQALVGKTITVLVESSESRNRHIGRSTGDAPEIDNLVYFTGSIRGPFAKILIETAEPYDLHGRVATGK